MPANEKDLKKISPDSVGEEKEKKYISEDGNDNTELMKAVFGDDGDELEIEVADGEEEIKKEEKKDVKKEDINSIDEIVEEVIEKKEEKPTEESSIEKKEQQQLELSSDAQNALKPYNGNRSEQIEQLVKAYNAALTKLQSYGHVQNVIKELGFDEMKPNELIPTMKELKTTAIDLMNNPVVLEVLESVAKGEVPKQLKEEEKTVNNYMPEDEVFDYNDSLTNRNSASWKARVQWEKERSEAEAKRQKFLESIGQKKMSATELRSKYQQATETLNTKLGELKAFASDNYEAGEETFNKFLKEFKSFDANLFKTLFAVFAKRNGIESKVLSKIKSNQKKSFAESRISDAVDESQSSMQSSKELDEKFSEAFADGGIDDDYVVY